MLKTFLWSFCAMSILLGLVGLGFESHVTLRVILELLSSAAAFASLTTLAAASENYDWNGGTCAAYNEPWEYFDSDSQGARGYKCRDKYIWISYPVNVRA